MNRLLASLSAAVTVTSLFVASPALADEEPKEPIVETERTAVEPAVEPAREIANEPPAVATTDIVFSSASDSAPVERDANVAPRSAADRTRVGALVGVGFPRPLSIAAFVKVNRVIGAGAEYGFLPRTSIMSADIEIKSVAADLRVFPFKNGVFVGLRGGRQWLDARASATVGSVTATESMTASTWFINPRVGVLHTFESGVTIGIDAGVQIPIAAEMALQDSHPMIAKTEAPQAMRSLGNALGNETTPTIDLLRVGFLF